MPGSAAPLDSLFNHPRKLLVRLAIVSLAALWLAKGYSANVIELLLPAVQAEITVLDGNMSILALELARGQPHDTVRLRANLRYPEYYKGSVIYPLGWRSHTEGWYQIDVNPTAMLQSSVIFLIAILSWPHRSYRELVRRLMIALPLLALLFAIDKPLELLGNFQHQVFYDVDPIGTLPLYAWAKFLEGGGAAVLALALAVVAISLAALNRSWRGLLRWKSKTQAAPLS